MDINQQIQQGIRASQMQAGYGVSMVPYHTHDGVNSPRIGTTAATTLYSGTVSSTGVTSGLLPSTWSVVYYPITHQYVVTHNLNTTNYSVATSCTTIGDVANVIAHDSTTFTIAGYAIAGAGGVNVGFMFILSTI